METFASKHVHVSNGRKEPSGVASSSRMKPPPWPAYIGIQTHGNTNTFALTYRDVLNMLNMHITYLHHYNPCINFESNCLNFCFRIEQSDEMIVLVLVFR
jgi:hypothetical protein